MYLLRKNLLLFFLFSSSLLARGQLITLSVEKQSLEKVLLLIEQQSDYRFIYSAEMMSASRPVTVGCKNETLVKALGLCFKEQPLNWAISEKHVVLQFKKTDPAQDKRLLRGRVVDQHGEGIPGISVLVRGTAKGTITASDGSFELVNVPERFRLVISGIQIETRDIIVGSEPFLTIETKQRTSPLDQTVVIGYGSGKRRYLVESVSKVDGDDIVKQPLSNPVLALAGRTAGLLVSQASGVPGSFVRVQLRGRNSLANGNDPLYIVDGVPFPASGLGDIFIAAGVTSSMLDNLNPAAIESIEILKDAAATAIYGSRGANGVILITTKKGQSQKPQVAVNAYTGWGKITRQIPLMNTSEFLSMRREAFANDNVVATISNAPDLKLWDTTRYTDWQKHLIGNQMRVSDINASIMVGNAQTRVLASTGYRSETSVFPGNFGQDKISGMMNVNHQSVDKKLNVSVSASFLQNNMDLPKDDPLIYTRLAPNAPSIYTTEGKLNWENSSWTNPYTALLQTFTSRSESWQSSLQASYRLLSDFEIRLTAGYTSIGQSEHFRTPLKALNPAQSPVARAGFGRKEIRTRMLEPQINYTKTLKELHRFNVLIGGSFQLSDQTGLHQQGSGYSSDDLLGSLQAASAITLTNETNIKYRYAAVFGRLQYDYAKRYLLTVSVRRDGSSRYGPENRFANFGSVGIGWILTSEKWLNKIKGLDFAKIRLSAGTTGNDQVGDYRYLDLYSPYSYSYQGATTFYPVQLFSPSYGWEKVTKLEAGIDLAFFKNRLNITVNYFYNTTNNQLINYTLPFSTGFSGVLRNIPATIRNTGLEIEASADIISNKNWKWNASFNITVPKNKLVDFENFASSTYANSYVIGSPLSITKAYRYTGVDPATGLYTFEDINKDGRLSAPADQQQVVVTAVEYYGGVENTVSWKSISLSFHLAFTKQPFTRNYYQFFNRPGSIDNQPDWVNTRWIKNGDIADIQRYSVTASAPNLAYSNLRQSNAAWSDGSFIRLRNLQLAYQYKVARVYITGQNLLLFSEYKSADPETGIALPPVRMITAGIQLTL